MARSTRRCWRCFGLEFAVWVCHVARRMGHANTPPQLPEVRDEAGNTPRWVPVLGALLFVIAAAAIVVRHTAFKDDDSEHAGSGESAP
jgi:hypothetical protein